MTDSNSISPDGRECRLDPRSIDAQRIAGGILAAGLGGALFIAAVTIALASGITPFAAVALALAWIVATAAFGAWAFFWPSVRYRHTSYSVDPRGMTIRRGVLWRTVVSVPRSRVQHTDVSQGPVERGFELSTLVVYTAGTQHASIVLSGLSRDVAPRLRDFLIDSDETDAV